MKRRTPAFRPLELAAALVIASGLLAAAVALHQGAQDPAHSRTIYERLNP